MTITISLVDLLAILGCILLVALIVLVCNLVKTVKGINQIIEKNEPHITNTLSNVDKMGTDTKDIYTGITEKILKFVSNRKEKKAKKSILDKE
jgi:uncharacterized protein YoxC